MKQMRKIRGNEISMIFQEPMTSLNPVFTVGNQIGEAIKLHQGLNKQATRAKTIEMLRLVKIADPESRVDAYPHQLSGGMRQRVMIAMALSCNPSLLIADEPTTALDVTIQAQILDLMKELQQKIGMALLLITHDLGVVAEQADDVAIMYAGKIVERSNTREIFTKPFHPYTVGPAQLACRAPAARKSIAWTRSPVWCPTRLIYPAVAASAIAAQGPPISAPRPNQNWWRKGQGIRWLVIFRIPRRGRVLMRTFNQRGKMEDGRLPSSIFDRLSSTWDFCR